MKTAVIGGTGNMGFGLAMRMARLGHEVIIGSRTAEKALDAASKILALEPEAKVCGMENPAAAREADLVVISVPAAGHRATVEGLKDIIASKKVLDITIPMAFKPLRYDPPAEGSDALETAAVLGEGCRVAAGFHTISATILCDPALDLEGYDTLVVGNDAELRDEIIALAKELGLNAYNAGTLTFSPVVESMTPMLIGMNKRYGSNHIGIRLTGF